MRDNQNQILSRVHLLQYSVLAVPLAFAGLPLYIHAPDFYSTQTNLSLGAIATILLFIRIFDAVQDPLIGYASDRFSRYRIHIMGCSLFTLATGFIMLFHPPSEQPGLRFALWLVLTTTSFSILVINLNALGSLWSKDYHQKTRITGYREALTLIGLFLGAALPVLLGLSGVSYLAAVLLAGTGFVFWHWYKNNNLSKTAAPLSTWPDAKRIFSYIQGSSGFFYIIYALSMLASAIPAVLVLFFIRDRLDAEALTGVFLLLYFLAGAAGMPFWLILARRIGKYNSWLMAMILAVVTFTSAFFLQEGAILAYGLICILSGLALGAELSLPPAILSDIIDQRSHSNRTSGYFAGLAFLSKTALALGGGMAFLFLDLAGFEPAQPNDKDALLALSMIYALLPCLIKAAAALLLAYIVFSPNHRNLTHEPQNIRINNGGRHGT